MENMNTDFTELENAAKCANSLKDLFDIWRKAHNSEPDYEKSLPKGLGSVEGNEFKSSFCPDGITSLIGKISKKTLDNTAKALFIQKESNLTGHLAESNGEKNFWFNDCPCDARRKYYASRMKHVLEARYADWAPDNPIGYMNLNKRGGTSTTDPKRLVSYISRYRWFILREIELISPETIFLCGCYSQFLVGIKDCADVYLEQQSNRLIVSPSVMPTLVDLYHLSYRGFYRKVNGASWVIK